MKVLVTGGAGYIGSTLVPALLAQGHEVLVLDSLLFGAHSLVPVWSHPDFALIQGDIRNEKTVEHSLEGVDAVVHLAAIVGDPACARQPDEAKAINKDASIALFRASQRIGVQRFIFASTCSNYGRMRDPSVYVDENSELSPVSLYAETKVAVEKFILDMPPSPDFCATILRFATIFGISPRMRFDLTVNEFTMEMLSGRKLVVFGEQFWRPYVHVRDAARAIVSVLENPQSKVAGQVFNVGSTDQNYKKRQIVEMIRPYAPESIVEYVQKQEDPRDYRVSFDKITRELGYSTTRTVSDGIREISMIYSHTVFHDFDEPMYRNTP